MGEGREANLEEEEAKRRKKGGQGELRGVRGLLPSLLLRVWMYVGVRVCVCVSMSGEPQHGHTADASQGHHSERGAQGEDGESGTHTRTPCHTAYTDAGLHAMTPQEE